MKNNAKLFVLQLGVLASLYISIGFLLSLTFAVIDLLVPDVIDSYWSVVSAGDQIRLAVATLVITVPAFFYLSRLVNQTRAHSAQNDYLPVTQWLIYISLLLGTAILLGYLVSVIYSFLNGELTVRFALKFASVLIVIGGAVIYYMLDARNYFIQNPKWPRYLAIGIAVVTFNLVSYGISMIDSPATVREVRIDEQQVQDFQEIEWRVEEALRSTNALPESVAALYQNSEAPSAPEGREPYSFTFHDESFALCATFVEPSPETDTYRPTALRPVSVDKDIPVYIEGAGDWTHPAGHYCFERSITRPSTTPEKDE